MSSETDSPDLLKQEILRLMPPCVVLAGTVAAAIVKRNAQPPVDGDALLVNLDPKGPDGLWEPLCAIFSYCGTVTADEWLVCGPAMLAYVRTQTHFVHAPEPIHCGETTGLTYIGKLRTVSVYATANKLPGTLFYAGVGAKNAKGIISTTYPFLQDAPPIREIEIVPNVVVVDLDEHRQLQDAFMQDAFTNLDDGINDAGLDDDMDMLPDPYAYRPEPLWPHIQPLWDDE